jgi:hypothetical protein
MPPSEISCLRKAGFEGFHMAELRPNVPGLRKVTFFEMGGSAMALAITLHDPKPGEAWKALRVMVQMGDRHRRPYRRRGPR